MQPMEQFTVEPAFGLDHPLFQLFGYPTTAELAERTWLRTYAGHGRHDDPFVAPVAN